jgi:hypothetical protein
MTELPKRELGRTSLEVTMLGPRKTGRKSPSGKPTKLFSKPTARLRPKHARWPMLCWLPVVRPPKL